MAAAMKSLFDTKHPGDQCTNCGHVVVRTPLKACMAALKQPCEPCGWRAGGANKQRGMAAAMKSLFSFRQFL
ncbi:hypothetical protein DIPPA_26025 [Diplonema papillatum]|nr:hypothetical protein DIPPA_26025 [Diplonema papillatum]